MCIRLRSYPALRDRRRVREWTRCRRWQDRVFDRLLLVWRPRLLQESTGDEHASCGASSVQRRPYWCGPFPSHGAPETSLPLRLAAKSPSDPYVPSKDYSATDTMPTHASWKLLLVTESGAAGREWEEVGSAECEGTASFLHLLFSIEDLPQGLKPFCLGRP